MWREKNIKKKVKITIFVKLFFVDWLLWLIIKRYRWHFHWGLEVRRGYFLYNGTDWQLSQDLCIMLWSASLKRFPAVSNNFFKVLYHSLETVGVSTPRTRTTMHSFGIPLIQVFVGFLTLVIKRSGVRITIFKRRPDIFHCLFTNLLSLHAYLRTGKNQQYKNINGDTGKTLRAAECTRFFRPGVSTCFGRIFGIFFGGKAARNVMNSTQLNFNSSLNLMEQYW